MKDMDISRPKPVIDEQGIRERTGVSVNMASYFRGASQGKANEGCHKCVENKRSRKTFKCGVSSPLPVHWAVGLTEPNGIKWTHQWDSYLDVLKEIDQDFHFGITVCMGFVRAFGRGIPPLPTP